MTNRSSSKQHGLKTVNRTNPKSKLRHRANKAKANALKAARRAILDQG